MTVTQPDLSPVASKAAWKGSQIDWQRDGLHLISAAELEEIDAALAFLRSRRDIDLPQITAADFPLPKLGPRLAALREELRRGVGFVLLRGLPRRRYEDDDDIARIYFGLGAHVGRAITQSRQGEFLGHVVNISDVDSTVRGYQYGGGQNMHSDSCDIIGLMCLRAAKSGGASRIVSAVAIHDALAHTRPDLLKLHYWGFTYRRNELDARLGGGVIVPPVPIATFARRDGELSCYLGTNYALRAAEAGDSVLSAAQREAIEIVQQIATSPEYYLDMQIGEGDIQFLNNRLIFHGRTAYEDHQDIALRRHMLRLWLRVDQWPALPANQRPHSDEDHRLWQRFRRPLMEIPSRFLADVERRRCVA